MDDTDKPDWNPGDASVFATSLPPTTNCGDAARWHGANSSAGRYSGTATSLVCC